VNTIAHVRTDVDDLELIIGTITGERLVPTRQGYTYVLDVRLAAPLLGNKVRVTVRQDAYAFQTSAKAEVLERATPKWNTLAIREGELIHDIMPSYVSRDDAAKRDAAHSVAIGLVREVFDLLV
jgi:hypothetical protein